MTAQSSFSKTLYIVYFYCEVMMSKYIKCLYTSHPHFLLPITILGENLHWQAECGGLCLSPQLLRRISCLRPAGAKLTRLSQKQNENKRAGSIGEWYSTCLACARPWVPLPGLQKMSFADRTCLGCSATLSPPLKPKLTVSFHQLSVNLPPDILVSL
jgi:hypothetical protein